MVNILKIFLSSILITSFTVSAKETFHELYITSLADSPFHPDIKISGSDNKKHRIEGNVKNQSNETYTSISEINWKDYASSWEQFKQYYKTITIYGTGYATGKEAPRKDFTNINILISSLEQRTTWHNSATLRASGSKYVLIYSFHQFGGGSLDEAAVYYDAIVSGSVIKIRFQIWTKAHQVGFGSIWTESQIQYNGGIVNSSWNPNTIKDSLNTALANQINLKSNYSGSLEDKRNIIDPTGKGNDQTTLINSVIAKILDKDYTGWKQYIQPFSFNNSTREATIIFKFPDPTTKQQQVWTFKTPVNITLSSDYWGKSLSERLHIQPGQIVNPEDSTKGMIPDIGLQLEPDQVSETYGGNMQYHTTAHVEFDGLEDSSEWMTVNGQPVEVLNNKFIYDMIDNRVENGNQADNVYDIIIYHDDGQYQEQYQIKYTIANLVPTLKEKWYAWDPKNNPDQNKLITSNLPNGKPNPDYDKEINVETGTKTQIIWVKKKSQYPFPLDPLDKNGEVIDPNKNAKDYDLGFIAEGSIAGMGVQQLFNANEVKSVTREGVDNALKAFPNPTDKQKLTTIIPDTDNKYWSWQGMWHYITKTSDGLAYEKYVLIGAKYQNKYPRFLDVLDDSSIAVDFWTTIHGLHLKNYLATYKNLDSEGISKLNYEQVVSYWKEYTSDIIAQRIPPNPNPVTYQDLSKITFSTIKMNLTTVELIKEEIINQVKQQLANTKLIYDEDYQLKPLDDENIKKLLDYDSNNNATITLNINALATSTRAIGSNTIKIINNTNYNPDTVIDLAKIKFQNQRWNFSEFSVDQLKAWILKDIEKTFEANKVDLRYPDDYGVEPLDDETLQQFINSENLVSLTITIYSQDDSMKTKGYTTLELINDPDGEIAPPEPPGPDPDPNPQPPDSNSWIVQKTNLIIMSVVAIMLVTTVGTIIFFKYRLKKGIGGKKIKKKN